MINRINLLLIHWAEQGTGGACVGAGGNAMNVAVTRLSKPRLVVDDLGQRPALLTAMGSETRVAKRSRVVMSDMALDVDKAVAQLPGHLREAVQVFYFEGGLALDVRAKRLGVTVRTMHRWLHSAHLLIDEYIFGRSEAS